MDGSHSVPHSLEEDEGTALFAYRFCVSPPLWKPYPIIGRGSLWHGNKLTPNESCSYQLPLSILSPAGAVYCRHYPLITSGQDLERICALSRSECGSESKPRPELCTQHGVLRNRPADAELVLFGCA